MRRILNSRFLGRTYFKFQIGFQPLNYILAFVTFLTFAKVWQSTFDYYGVPFWTMLFVFPMFLLGVAAVLGHIMIKKNVQGEIQSLINTEANPELLEIFKRFDKLDKRIDRLQEELSRNES